MEEREYRNLFDSNRICLKETMIRSSVQPKNTFILSTHVVIINSKKQMLIQKRSADKKVFPSLYDVTLGSGVKAGETSNEAATREIQEELGLNFDFTKIRPSFTINYSNGFDDFFVIKQDIDINKISFTDGEVVEVKWATIDEILKLINTGIMINYKPSLIKYIFDCAYVPGLYNK